MCAKAAGDDYRISWCAEWLPLEKSCAIYTSETHGHQGVPLDVQLHDCSRQRGLREGCMQDRGITRGSQQTLPL
eukprot:scaffold6198_cov408-Prasinococcus_capsulatus_cf.AAC.5